MLYTQNNRQKSFYQLSACHFFIVTLFICLNKTHKNKNYKKTNVANLLSEVKVSSVTIIPCVLYGTIIGRGNPGYF